MHLTRIVIENIRAVERMSLDLTLDASVPQRRAILLGPNGCGKTTVLQSIADLFCSLRPELGARRLDAGDVRLPARTATQPPVQASVAVDAVLDTQELEHGGASGWLSELKPRVSLRTVLGGGSTQPVGADLFQQLVTLGSLASEELRLRAALHSALSSTSRTPCVYVPARRSLTIDDDVKLGALRLEDPWTGALSIAPWRFDPIAPRLAMAFAAPGRFDPERRVERMWKVLDKYFPELPRPIEVDGFSLVLENRAGTAVRIDQLSDGEQAILLVFGELALRRPDGGVVLIDEIEQHLHPRWQRALIEALPAFIPSAQWILTTQAPYVAACAPDDVIRLGDWDRDGE